MSAPLESAPPFAETPPPRKRRTGRIILIVVAAVIASMILLFGLLFLFVNSSTKDAQKISDQFVTAVQAGDGKTAYSLSGPAFQKATTEAQLTELAQRLSGLVAKGEVSPSGKSINASTDTGKIAVFTYTLKGTNGGSIYFKTQVRDEDAGWQVMNFRSSETALSTDVE